MCQQKLAMLFLVQNELGASLAEGDLNSLVSVLNHGRGVRQYHGCLQGHVTVRFSSRYQGETSCNLRGPFVWQMRASG